MPTLTELLEGVDPANPLRPYVQAVLDAGMILTLRDGAGHLVTTSPAFAALLGREGTAETAVGMSFMDGQRFFDEHGRELTRTDHPAQVARRTGVPQRQRILGIRERHGDEAWLLISYLPIRSTPEGWEVLAVGAPLSRSVFRPPTEATTDDLPCAASLIAFALDVSGQRYSPTDLAERLRPVVRALVPQPTSISLMIRRDSRLYPTPRTRYGNHPVVESLRMSDDAVDRWDRNRTVYIPELQPTAIVGDRVVVEYEDPVRSMALIPIWDGPRRVASFVAASPEAHALSPQQIAGLAALGRLAGPALEDCPATQPATA